MASAGKEKHARYFSNGIIETTLVAGETIPVYDHDGKKLGVVAGQLPVSVICSSVYAPKYHVQWNDFEGFVSERYIRKPLQTKGASENLSLKSTALLQGSPIKQFQGTSVHWFETLDEYQSCILDNIPSLTVEGSIKETLHDIFTQPNERFAWDSTIAKSSQNELGKYIGEILVPFHWCNSISSVAYPIASNNPSVDVYVLKDQKTYGISHKFGAGARASLFNLIYTEYFDDCVFQKLSKYFLENENKIEAIYRLGFETVAKMDMSDPLSVYRNLQRHAADDRLATLTPQDELIKKYFPLSLTSWFCRDIAKQLNDCPISMDMINKTIISKNIVQARLDCNAWLNGEIKYSFHDFNQCNVKIVGNKSAANDIRQKQGLLNYALFECN